ncbi:MAG: 3-oxoacyl-[acyl-carrier-protein] reductase [Planctomycetota bacterium]|nr:MAG: 3-oxoacyl-[acyl-carrier-protein] reductase [Planctomycetota bacterium]
MDFKGKTVVITGASRGIGKAIAQAFAEKGANLVLVARNGEKLEEVKREMGNDSTLVFPMDVRDGQKVQEAVDAILKERGAIHVLVNNAGITRDNLLLRMKEEEWQEVMDINCKSVFLWSKGVIRSMIRNREGSIINISSVVGLSGNPGQTNYAASKAAIIGFSKSLAKEVGSKGIRVNVIAPGFVETDMVRHLPKDYLEKARKEVPLGRLGQASEIAQVCLFLASPMASYITGAVIQADGGLFM